MVMRIKYTRSALKAVAASLQGEVGEVGECDGNDCPEYSSHVESILQQQDAISLGEMLSEKISRLDSISVRSDPARDGCEAAQELNLFSEVRSACSFHLSLYNITRCFSLSCFLFLLFLVRPPLNRIKNIFEVCKLVCLFRMNLKSLPERLKQPQSPVSIC